MKWDSSVRDEFLRLAAVYGFAATAAAVHISRATMYRIAARTTNIPTRAVRANILQFIAERREQQKQ